jgi:hypothetical protein
MDSLGAPEDTCLEALYVDLHEAKRPDPAEVAVVVESLDAALVRDGIVTAKIRRGRMTTTVGRRT